MKNKQKKTIIVVGIILLLIFLFQNFNINTKSSSGSMAVKSSQYNNFYVTSLAETGECRPDGEDSEMCCDEPGTVFCGDTDVCGPSEGWCDNFLESGKSCIPGEDWCCLDSGYIADYSAHWCCPPEYPFYGVKEPHKCWNNRIKNSNNYYTTLSECYYWYDLLNSKWEQETGCDGYEYKECVSNKISNFVDGWKRITTRGKCGVECTSDEQCSPNSCVNFKCVQTCFENWQCSGWSSCVNNQQTRTCTDSNSCGTETNKPETTKSCTEPVCEDKVNMCGGECPPCPEKNIFIYLLIGFLAIVGGFYFLYKKSKRRKR